MPFLSKHWLVNFYFNKYILKVLKRWAEYQWERRFCSALRELCLSCVIILDFPCSAAFLVFLVFDCFCCLFLPPDPEPAWDLFPWGCWKDLSCFGNPDISRSWPAYLKRVMDKSPIYQPSDFRSPLIVHSLSTHFHNKRLILTSGRHLSVWPSTHTRLICCHRCTITIIKVIIWRWSPASSSSSSSSLSPWSVGWPASPFLVTICQSGLSTFVQFFSLSIFLFLVVICLAGRVTFIGFLLSFIWSSFICLAFSCSIVHLDRISNWMRNLWTPFLRPENV